MFKEINGCRIFVEEAGNRQGVPIIFLHGFPFDHSLWNDQLNALPFRNIAYDIRGFGKSDVGDGIYTIELFVDDLFQLMDALQIPKAIICGISMGGYIALRAAQRNPERILGGIFCNTRAGADNNQGKLNRAENIAVVKKEGVSYYVEKSYSNLFSDNSKKKYPEVVNNLKKIMADTKPLAICGGLLAMAGRLDTTEGLKDMEFPCLLIGGKEDTVIPKEGLEAMHEKLPNSELYLIEGVAHLSNLENANEFNSIVTNWVNKHFKEFI